MFGKFAYTESPKSVFLLCFYWFLGFYGCRYMAQKFVLSRYTEVFYQSGLPRLTRSATRPVAGYNYDTTSMRRPYNGHSTAYHAYQWRNTSLAAYLFTYLLTYASVQQPTHRDRTINSRPTIYYDNLMTPGNVLVDLIIIIIIIIIAIAILSKFYNTTPS